METDPNSTNENCYRVWVRSNCIREYYSATILTASGSVRVAVPNISNMLKQSEYPEYFEHVQQDMKSIRQ